MISMSNRYVCPNLCWYWFSYSLITVLFTKLDSGLAVNQAFRFLKASFLLFLDTFKLYSVISRCPFSPFFTSSYDFSIAQFFSILKLYPTFLAVYSDNPSSFNFKIWHLFEDFFPRFLVYNCLPKGDTSS